MTRGKINARPNDAIGEEAASRHHNRGMRRKTIFDFGKIRWRRDEVVVEEHQNIEIQRRVDNRIALRGQTARTFDDMDRERQLRRLGSVKVRGRRRTNKKRASGSD